MPVRAERVPEVPTLTSSTPPFRVRVLLKFILLPSNVRFNFPDPDTSIFWLILIVPPIRVSLASLPEVFVIIELTVNVLAVLLSVVTVTFVPEFNAPLIVGTVDESITTSDGSISHKPSRPASIFAPANVTE